MVARRFHDVLPRPPEEGLLMRTLFDRRFGIWVGLALLMALTRSGHFSAGLAFADASWAVFLLGGALLRTSMAFLGLSTVAVAVDVAAFTLGRSTACVSPGYLFLIPAHAALFGAGLFTGIGTERRVLRVVATTVLGVAAAYAISNAGFFAFAPDLRTMSLHVFVQRVIPYLPAYVVTALAYTLAGHFVARAAPGLAPAPDPRQGHAG
jgi:hypothetical protein